MTMVVTKDPEVLLFLFPTCHQEALLKINIECISVAISVLARCPERFYTYVVFEYILVSIFSRLEEEHVPKALVDHIYKVGPFQLSMES